MSTATNVYLPAYNSPNFSVTIRDTTGSTTSSIRISTIGTARFLDGTNLYTINNPYGLVNLAFRSSIWQILHTSGQSPATAAANVTTLHTSTSVFEFLSSGVKYASSLAVNTLVTTNAITLNNTLILENLSAPGVVVIQSSLNVYGDVRVDGQLFVSGPAQLLGSLFVNELLPVSSLTDIQATLAVGNNLSVGGLTFIQGSFTTLSTNFATALQVQFSTLSDAALTTQTLNVNGSISSLLGLAVTSQYTSPGLLTLFGDVSSFAGHVSTQFLDVGGSATFTQSISSLTTATFLSSLQIASSLGIQGPVQISTQLIVRGDMYLSSFSSVRFSTLSSFSTATLVGLSSVSIRGGFSTAVLRSLGFVSIGTSFYTPAVVSSQQTTFVVGELDVREGTTLSNAFLSSSVGVAENVLVSQTSFFGQARFRGSLSTQGALFTGEYTEIKGSVGVYGNVTIDSNIVVQDGSIISSFFVNSFLLSNVEVLTSSPFTSFTASTLNASSIQTQVTQISVTAIPTFAVGSTFASTTQFTTAVAEATRVQTVRASNVQWGAAQTLLSLDSKPSFVLNTNSLFPTGASSQIVRAQTILADILSGRFLGDGANISNIAVPYAHLSALKTVASTVSTAFLTGSTLNVSSFYSQLLVSAVSSFSTPTLLIQAAGYSPVSSVNQLVALGNRSMVLNHGIFFDTTNQRIGVQMSSPLYALDINGSLYASNVYFNSITALGFSTSSVLYLSTVNANSTIVRDTAFYPPGGLQVLATGSNNASFLIQTTSTPTSTFGLFSYTSTIALNNAIFVHNDLQRVMVNGLSNGTILVPPYDFSVQDKIYATNAYLSSLNLSQTLNTASLNAQSLRIQYTPELNYNTISTTNRLLYLNNLLSITNDGPALCVKGLAPSSSVALDVRGNAYFSTLTCTGTARSEFLFLGSELL
jgi:cytoskeletal protein CcmA (bactofilin family)